MRFRQNFLQGVFGLQATRRPRTMAIAMGAMFDAVRRPQSTCLLKQLIMKLGYIDYVSVKSISRFEFCKCAFRTGHRVAHKPMRHGRVGWALAYVKSLYAIQARRSLNQN